MMSIPHSPLNNTSNPAQDEHSSKDIYSLLNKTFPRLLLSLTIYAKLLLWHGCQILRMKGGWKMNEQYIRNLIKGKIAEVIFEEMFREAGEFTVLPIGYEHTIPELAQYQHHVQVKKVLDNIRNAPDFALISQDKTKVYLVEVKYREAIQSDEVLAIANELLTRWDPVYLFLATKKVFFFSPCHTIVNNAGQISEMTDNWIALEEQHKYLDVFLEFIKSPME